MNDEQKRLQLRLLILRKQFIFDRIFAFSLAILGLLISMPFFLFLSGAFFLLTAIDVWRVRRLEKKLAVFDADIDTPAAPQE